MGSCHPHTTTTPSSRRRMKTSSPRRSPWMVCRTAWWIPYAVSGWCIQSLVATICSLSSENGFVVNVDVLVGIHFTLLCFFCDGCTKSWHRACALSHATMVLSPVRLMHCALGWQGPTSERGRVCCTSKVMCQSCAVEWNSPPTSLPCVRACVGIVMVLACAILTMRRRGRCRGTSTQTMTMKTQPRTARFLLS